jgi:hypothetical protein
MTSISDALFEALMTAAERLDELRQRSGAKVALFALLAAAISMYALSPGPYAPQIPCPMDGTIGIGLAPPLWWVGGGPEPPLLSSMGLDPNSRIRYQVLLGTAEEDMVVVGTVEGGRGRENLVINLTEPLSPGTAYLWRVEAENLLKKRSPGEVWTFGTRDLPEIQLFEADKSVVDLGDDLILRWSVADASEVEIEPGIGPVPLRGETTLSLREGVNYTLVARNFAGESTATVEVGVLPSFIIDSMAGGWSTTVDGLGSRVLGIGAVPEVEEDATRISFDLLPGGWAGITKTPSRRGGGLDLTGTDGVSFYTMGAGSGYSLEVWLRGADGTVHRRSWDAGVAPMTWTRMEAFFEEFECIEAGGSRCTDEALDAGNISAISFIVAARGEGGLGSSGWIAIDDLVAFRREGLLAEKSDLP